jgi:hypothetical protein
MVLIFLAFILLLFLIYINKTYESMLSNTDASNYSTILSSKDTDTEKINELKDILVEDDILNGILNNNMDDDEKLVGVIKYFDELLYDRNFNKNSVYETYDDAIMLNYDQFMGVLSYLYNDKYTSTERMAFIRKLNIRDPSFTDVLNTTSNNNDIDDIILFGYSPNDKTSPVVTPNIASLIQEILSGNYPRK